MLSRMIAEDAGYSTFSLHLDTANNSFLQFGEVDQSWVQGETVWMDNTRGGPETWGNTLSGIRIDGKDYFDSLDFAVRPKAASLYSSG